ncbi:RNA polymerase sigma factor [Polluticaenibacter yanchengensis]|uniref:Sigma-70 family RNA polymerase sigma factor n=1 Tax=Polluticaenibacter yanchengensis TaxID=3014562 RepID=A0ABT4UFH0_9BACT|nr:sigma-70 family RNA polymerase sigma factor [Chitinophagaceae bacterium LY-5]
MINKFDFNNETTLQNIYIKNYHKIEKYVVDNSGTKDDAKDLYQEAFIALWRNIQLNKFMPANEAEVTAYLYTIARNKWLDVLRTARHKNEKKSIEIETLPEIKQDDIKTDLENEIKAVSTQFKKLGQNCKEVLTKFYFKKESLKAIGEQFGWTEATAKNNKYRCLQHLRALVKKKL